jgi:hypothetical protein
VPPYGRDIANQRADKEVLAMFDRTDIAFDIQRERVRQAEARYALMAALRSETTEPAPTAPRRRVLGLLRRIAGMPAAA